MKNYIYIFFCFFIISCKAQDTLGFDVKKKNIIVLNFLNKEPIQLTTQKVIYENVKTKIVTVLQANEDMGTGHFSREFVFIQNKDSMNIVCSICGKGGSNYYFKNLKFKKGNYDLRFEYPKKYNSSSKKYEPQIIYIFGKQIETPKEVQHILFKYADYDMLRNPIYKDLNFKDLKFIEIDLKDSINVKLKQLD